MGQRRKPDANDEPDPADGGDGPSRPFERFTDVLLRAEAAGLPDDGGGSDIGALVARLPSFDDGGVRRQARGALADERQRTRLDLHRALSGDDALAVIAANARLDVDAAELLAVLVAVELDPVRSLLVRRLTGAPSGAATVGLLHRLLGPGHAGLRAIVPDGALQRACLVRPLADDVWSQIPVRLESGVAWAVIGDDSAEIDLPLGASRIASPGVRGDCGLLLVPGADVVRRRDVALEHAAADRFLVVPAPNDEDGWRAVVREATLTGHAVVVELDDQLPAPARRWIERARHLVWVLSSRAELPVDQLPNRPWREVRAGPATATAAEIAGAFGADVLVPHRLTAHQLDQVGRVLAERVDRRQAVDGDDVTRAVRRLASGELDRLAVRIRPRRSWDELVLPDEQLTMVRDVIERYRHRATVYEDWDFKPLPSAGVVAMFAGPPGTGKTLSAEIIAGELGLDLFRIDLASLVSKYIGETEKNLERIFRAAEGGTMVLLFDEADAVFGKRSEVSDANDRYANVETSYLLQRLECYEGVAILTTNYASNIDEAFLRRIHASVEFPQPDEAERLRLWAQSFPVDAPLGDLDLPYLARQFRLTGAAIRSVALAAAFRAASGSGRIAMGEVVTALQGELRKQGRLTTVKAFAPYEHLLVP